MQNFAISFNYPALLLLIIPAIGIALIPYFRISKKYRKTRNRIISLVLHCTVMVLSISVLAGIRFNYQVPNETNEIILLVDSSNTEEQSNVNRDQFIKNVLDSGRYDDFKIGVVTFGFDQKYAVPLTYDIDNIYNDYIASELPDASGTDLAAALTYTKNLFENPQTGKIVLITDGKETDENAQVVIKSVAAQGIVIDTVYISSDYSEQDMQIVDISLPDYHVNVGDVCTVGFTVQSNSNFVAAATLTDNGVSDEPQTFAVAEGSQSFAVEHIFQEEGMHVLSVEISNVGDHYSENNKYYAYLNIEVFNNILILQRSEGESDLLKDILTEDEEYNVTVLNVKSEIDLNDIPSTVEELCEYDQVILNNIANADMPGGFIEILYSYVNDFGGGLCTVGGNDEFGEANAYNRTDMYGTLYQQMLPVQAINYTPPVGVIVIIDRSGSMGENYGGSDDTRLDWARAGASACLDALTERDYFGLMTLDSDFGTILPLTPRTKDNVIRSAIASVTDATGGTVFPGAIDRAGQALRNLKNVSKRHIIIVTDGEVPESQEEDYLSYINNYYENDGITLSIVGIGLSEGSDAAVQMQTACAAGHGRLHMVDNSEDLIREMREDLNAPEIKELNYETFNPVAYKANSSLFNNIQLDEGNQFPVTLDGFYGVKVRDEDYLVLVGDYNVPIYAQWKFGKGMVGSFMSDLSGNWSSEFLRAAEGKQFVKNIVNNLMPVQRIKPDAFSVSLNEGNYINQLSIYADLQDGEYVTGMIASSDGEIKLSLNSLDNGNEECYVSVSLGEANHFSRSTFILKRAGIYQITLNKCDSEGNVLASYTAFKTFSYSGEYDIFFEESDNNLVSFLYGLAEAGGGTVIVDFEDPSAIFDNFITALDRVYDPSMIFIIVAIVLFLLDIAVRKFKFKWIHELVRERKNKEEQQVNKTRLQ